MSFDGAIARPPRCVLVNVTSGESMECLFNPTQLSEKLQVNWNRLAVPGLSHQVLQFQSTANRQLSGVEFYLDRYFAAEQPGDVNILEFRAFLRALTVPPEGTEDVAATAPPRVGHLTGKVRCCAEAPAPSTLPSSSPRDPATSRHGQEAGDGAGFGDHGEQAHATFAQLGPGPIGSAARELLSLLG